MLQAWRSLRGSFPFPDSRSFLTVECRLSSLCHLDWLPYKPLPYPLPSSRSEHKLPLTGYKNGNEAGISAQYLRYNGLW